MAKTIHPGYVVSECEVPVLESVRASGIEDPNVSYADCRDFQESLQSISGLALNQ